MWSVDKWLDGDELKQDEVNRAITMREKTLQITEKQSAEIESLQKAGKEAVSCFTRMETLYKIKCKELEIAKSEAIKEFESKVLDLFPIDKDFTTISRFTVKRIAKEMEGGTDE